jgi:predicted transcriptional regulator
VGKELLDKISIYVPKSKLDQHPVERLLKLADAKDRSVNYLVVEAIIEYLTREEKKKV